MIKKIIVTTTLVIVVAVFFSATRTNYTHIEQDKVADIILENPDAIILDVRTQEEYERKHIPHAVLSPIENLREGDFSAIPDKNKVILIYCWTGRRAEDSAKFLVENGYKNIYEFGGLVEWNGKVEGTEVD